MDPSARLAVTRAATRLAHAVVGLAFIAAGTAKVIHPATFITDIWSYRMMPEAWAYWVAAFLPWLEIVCGAALVTHRQYRGARLIAATLLLVFLGAIVLAWSRGLDIACGCFGGTQALETTNYPWLITRDLLLLAGLTVEPALSLLQRRRQEQEKTSSGPAPTVQS